MCCFFLMQTTAYEMRISDWSSDVCSSDLLGAGAPGDARRDGGGVDDDHLVVGRAGIGCEALPICNGGVPVGALRRIGATLQIGKGRLVGRDQPGACAALDRRSEEHTSELQSLMRISYAVFFLKKKKQK